MPARTCSATRAAVNNPSPMTAGTNDAHGGDICLIAVPSDFGNNSGITKNHRNNWTSNGMLRNSSTYALPIRPAHLFGVVRITPMNDPRNNAMIPAQKAVANVQPKPMTSVMAQVCRPSADISQKMPQFQL